MKKEFYKCELKLLLIMLGVILFINFASSVAVTAECSDRTPCYMSRSSERVFSFPLQYAPSDSGNVVLRFMILDDAGGLAEVFGNDEIIVEQGKSGTAQIKVRIPEDFAQENINIILKVMQFPESSGSQQKEVQFSPSFTMSFPVIIQDNLPAAEQIEESGNGIWFVIAIVLVLAVLIAIGIVIVKERR